MSADVPIGVPVRRDRWARRMRVGAVGLAVVITAVAGWAWATHPGTLNVYGNSESGPAAVATTLYVDTEISTAGHANRTPEVTLDSLRPKILTNTSHARLEFLVCERNGGGLGVGTQEGGLSDSCTRVIPLTLPARLRPRFSVDQIIVRVIPTTPGVLHIAGFDVRYRQGIRFGHQLAGTEMTFTSS